MRFRRDVGPRDLETGNFSKLLADDAAVAAWERFALRTANTPGRERVVLLLAFDDEADGHRWYLWASYQFTGRELAVDRVEFVIESVFIPNEDGPYDELRANWLVRRSSRHAQPRDVPHDHEASKPHPRGQPIDGFLWRFAAVRCEFFGRAPDGGVRALVR